MKIYLALFFSSFISITLAATTSAFAQNPQDINTVDNAQTLYAHKILLVVAMYKEASPIIEKLHLKKVPHVFSGLPMQRYAGHYANKDIFLIINGKDPMYHVDNVGTQPAALATYLGIKHFDPDLVISIGTAGGIKEYGAKPGDIYISRKIYFMDRRIPGKQYMQYGLGGYLSPDFNQIANKIGMNKGIICTGNSFDLSPTDKEMINKLKCNAEEMEAASVAWVSMIMHKPMIAIKGIGNIAGTKNNAQEYIKNGPYICNKLAETLKQFISDLPDKQLSYKEVFTFRSIVKGLNLNKSIIEQKEVELQYIDNGAIKTVAAKHDIVMLFKINNEYFVIGRPISNPLSDHPIELKASIGGIDAANYSESLGDSLNNEINAETNREISLSDFTISSYHIVSRQPNWGPWSVAFIEVFGLSKTINDMHTLKKTIASINENVDHPYGIYKLDDVFQAAKKTAGLPEGPNKMKTQMKNYLSNKTEDIVIFNDNDMDKMFGLMSPDQLF